jgi:hypothetical protein
MSPTHSLLSDLETLVVLRIIHECMHFEVSFVDCPRNIVLFPYHLGLGERIELGEAAISVGPRLDAVKFRLALLVELAHRVQPIGDIVVMRSDIDKVTTIVAAHDDVLHLQSASALPLSPAPIIS